MPLYALKLLVVLLDTEPTWATHLQRYCPPPLRPQPPTPPLLPHLFIHIVAWLFTGDSHSNSMQQSSVITA